MKYWWKERDHSLMINTIKGIVADNQSVYDNIKTLYSIYRGRAPVEYPDVGTGISISPWTGKLNYNIIRVCVDTLVSRLTSIKAISKNRCSVASVELATAAQDMDHFVQGVQYETKAELKTKKTMRDAILLGCGWYTNNIQNNRIVGEYKCPLNIIVDYQAHQESDKIYDIFEVSHIDRSMLYNMYPGAEDIIKNASSSSKQHRGTKRYDKVDVYDGWRVKIGDTMGVHMVVTSNGVLFEEDWEYETLPYALMTYDSDVMGIAGIGVGNLLYEDQLELNYLFEKYQRGIDLATTGYWLNPKDSGATKSQLKSDKDTKIIEVNTMASVPSYVAPVGVSPDITDGIERIIQRALQKVGLTQMSAAGVPPAGVTAASALRLHLDVETRRFNPLAVRWEQLHVDISNNIINLARKYYKDNEESYMVQYPNNKYIGKISFEDIDLEENNYQIQAQPISALALSISGDIERIVELFNSKNIPYAVYAELMGSYDIDKEQELASAPARDLRSVFEHMINKGKYIPPIQYQDLQLGTQLALQYYADATTKDIPEERIQLILDWLKEAGNILKKANNIATQEAMAMQQSQMAQQAQMAQPMTGGPGLAL